MPQLDFSTFAAQIFWLAIIFFAFYWIVSCGVLPKIRSTLKNRQDKISHDLDEASTLKSEAEAAKTDFTSALDNARQEALQLHQDAQAMIKKEVEQAFTDLNKKLSQKIETSDKALLASHEKSLERLAPLCADLAKQVFVKLIPIQWDTAALDKSLERYRKEAS